MNSTKGAPPTVMSIYHCWHINCFKPVLTTDATVPPIYGDTSHYLYQNRTTLPEMPMQVTHLRALLGKRRVVGWGGGEGGRPTWGHFDRGGRHGGALGWGPIPSFCWSSLQGGWWCHTRLVCWLLKEFTQTVPYQLPRWKTKMQEKTKMSVYVCTCAHVCVCVCVCEHVCMHTCMRICVCDEMTTYPYAFGSASGSYKMGHHK